MTRIIPSGIRFQPARQEKAEDGSVMCDICVGANAQSSMMPLDNAARNPKPQPGSIHLLGGEERLEDSGSDVRGHPMPCIGYRKAYSGLSSRRTMFHHVGPHHQPSPIAHRVDGVGDQVIEHLADVVFKAQDLLVRGVTHVQLNAGVIKATCIKA